MIIKHEIKSYLKTLFIWTIVIAGMDFSYMLMYPSLHNSLNEMMDASKNMGPFTDAFGMNRMSIDTPLGFYGIYVGLILSLGGALFAAIVGTGVLSKEEGGHTSEFLYTLPYSRVKIVFYKITALFLIILFFELVNLLVGLLSFPVIDAALPFKEILIFHISQLFLHFEIAALSILISAFTKKVNIGIGLGVALLLFFLDMMSRVLDQLDFTKYLNPFNFANPANIISSCSIDQPLLFIGLGIALGCLLLGTWYYEKRDLAA